MKRPPKQARRVSDKPPPPQEHRMSDLVYNGVAIREEGERLNATDSWKAAGSPPNLRPIDWLRTDRARELAAFLADTDQVGQNHLVTTTKGTRGGGRGGATWMHWKLALAYAADLSPAFKSWMLDVVRVHMESKSTAEDLRGIRESDAIMGVELAMVKRELADMKMRLTMGACAPVQHRMVKSAKRRAAELMVEVGFSSSIRAALRELQNGLRDKVGWGGASGQRDELLPADLYTRALAFLEGEANRSAKILKRLGNKRQQTIPLPH